MILYKFYASWCNPCKQQTKEFEENPVNAEVYPIDIDEETDNELQVKYNVRSIPTIILTDNDGNVIQKWIGFTKSSVINEFIDELGGTKSPEGE